MKHQLRRLEDASRWQDALKIIEDKLRTLVSWDIIAFISLKARFMATLLLAN
jgi:hypothetical protein